MPSLALFLSFSPSLTLALPRYLVRRTSVMCSGATPRNKAPLLGPQCQGQCTSWTLTTIEQERRQGGEQRSGEAKRGKETRDQEERDGDTPTDEEGVGGSFVIACALLHCVISSSIQLSEICFSFLLFRSLRRSQFDASFVNHWYTSVASQRCQKDRKSVV